MAFVEKRMWNSQSCYIQMKPRFRMLYSAALCSFVPFATRLAFESLEKSDQKVVNLDSGTRSGLTTQCFLGGLLDGTLLSACILSFKPLWLFQGGLLGSLIGLGYSQLLWELALRRNIDAF